MAYSTESTNFTKAELSCHCGCGLNKIDSYNLEGLELLREKNGGAPLNINSSCRCKIHNEHVGGCKTSFHANGYMAFDIAADDHDMVVLKGLADEIFEEVITYPDFIHVAHRIA